MIQSPLAREGSHVKLLDPTEKEAIMLNNQAVQFMKDLEKNPMKARQDFKNVILPHMMRALRTVQVLDDQLGATELELKKFLKLNVVLVDLLKQKGIDMPNFAAIEQDVLDEQAQEHATRGLLQN